MKAWSVVLGMAYILVAAYGFINIGFVIEQDIHPWVTVGYVALVFVFGALGCILCAFGMSPTRSEEE